MNPNAATLWRGPRWTLALLLACLGMIGPFSIDTYLPAFTGIAQTLGATPLQMQQTLSSYLLGFAAMNLFHGALSDSLGRRPVVLAGVALFTLASVGCALSNSIAALVFFRALQGLSAGAGMVVSRAIIRDMFAPADAQRVMSQVTIYFGVAPAVAPLFGGALFEYLGWHSIFWLLAGLGAALWLAVWRLLPETLHTPARQPFEAKNLLRGYAQLLRNPRFLALVLASGVPFNGMFLYVLSAPVFLGEHLRLAPT
jgi:MFS transporter, DHA1 family, multidrug resistance protein